MGSDYHTDINTTWNHFTDIGRFSVNTTTSVDNEGTEIRSTLFTQEWWELDLITHFGLYGDDKTIGFSKKIMDGRLNINHSTSNNRNDVRVVYPITGRFIPTISYTDSDTERNISVSSSYRVNENVFLVGNMWGGTSSGGYMSVNITINTGNPNIKQERKEDKKIIWMNDEP